MIKQWSIPNSDIYVSKFKNRIKFKMKTGYHLELLTQKTLKILRSAERRITEKGQKWWKCATTKNYMKWY